MNTIRCTAADKIKYFWLMFKIKGIEGNLQDKE